jgi:hypothetical protein
MYTLHHAQRYVSQFGLPMERLSEQERADAWGEVASQNADPAVRQEHAEALAARVTAEIAAVTKAAKDRNIEALNEIAGIVLTAEIVHDILADNIAGLVLGTKNVGPYQTPHYTEKRLNRTGVFQNVPSIGAVPAFNVAHMHREIPIGMQDNQAAYLYKTRNQYVGEVEERDEAAAAIRRGILENRENCFIDNIREATRTTTAAGNVLVHGLPDMALPGNRVAPSTNVLVDNLATGLTKKNISDMMFMLEFYGFQPRVIYCSALRRNDMRNFVTLTSTSGSPLDFFTQREVLQSGKLEGLFGVQLRVLNYLADDELFMWDNTREFGDIYLRGGVQVEDRQGPQPFTRELVAAQIEGQALYNARRIVKLKLIP